MTNEQKTLLNKVVKAFEEKGAIDARHANCDTIIDMVMNTNDLVIKTETKQSMFGGTYEDFTMNGVTISIEETYRCNGTAENKSVYVYVRKWENNTGYGQRIGKISQKDGARKLNRIIDEAINVYNEKKGA